MIRIRTIAAVCGAAAAIAGIYSAGALAGERRAEARVYELRTYTPGPGKLDALLARFRDHTTKLFEKHGIKNVGYWVTAEAKPEEQKLVYIVSHPDREKAAKHWKEFGEDSDWQKVRTESEKDGRLALKVESVYLTPTDFSKLR
jgi:hypothetical protein